MTASASKDKTMSSSSSSSSVRASLLFAAAALFAVGDATVCPIGYEDVTVAGDNEQMCWRVKDKERYFEKYEKCSGNAAPVDLEGFDAAVAELNVYEDSYFWVDYVRVYEGGPFVNWLVGDERMGVPMPKDAAAAIDNFDGTEGEMCLAMSLLTKRYRAVDCEERHFRLCAIRSYPDSYVASWDCPSGYLSFSSPIASCVLMHPTVVGLRATRHQASAICHKNSGYLLHKGYVYSNHPEFVAARKYKSKEIPLGMVRDGDKFVWEQLNETVAISELNFNSEADFNASNTYVSLVNGELKLRGSQYIYNRVMCEYFVESPKIDLYLFKIDTILIFKTNYKGNFSGNIWCFTDSIFYYPIRVPFTETSSPNEYLIETVGDGYYWCLINNTIEYKQKSSDKILYIKDEELTSKLYALMIWYQYLPSVSITKNFTLVITKELNSRISQEDTRVRSQSSENEQENFITNLKIKRIIRNGNILFHAQLSDIGVNIIKSMLSRNAQIDDSPLKVVYLRKLLECDAKDLTEIQDGFIYSYMRYPIGETINTHECMYYLCSGDFNVGAYWVKINETNFCINTETTTETTTNFAIDSTTSIMSTTDAVMAISTMSPNEQISEIADILQNVVNGSVNTTQLATITNQLNNVLDLGNENDIPKSVLQNLDAIINKVELPENLTQIKIIQPNIGIFVADRSGPTPVVGIKVSTIVDGIEDNSLQPLTSGDMNHAMGNTSNTEMIVNLPLSIGSSNESRLSFVIFKNDNAFGQGDSKQFQKVNSRILSISLTNTTKFAKNQYVDIYLKPYEGKIKNRQSKSCAYWDFSAGKNGNWSTEGCYLVTKAKGSLDMCRCDHLTHFAQIIMMSDENIGEINNMALSIISDVGCILSLIGLFVIGLTGLLFKSWRRDFNNKIWMHLSAAVAFLMITFFVISMVNMPDHNDISCIILGVILHYSLLASFCWMFVSALLSYKRLVTVFSIDSSHRLLKACIFGWVVPSLPIIILFAFDEDAYSQVNHVKRDFCYPTGLGFWLTVFTPVVLIIIANAVLFVVIIYSVFMNSSIQRHGDTKQVYRSLTVSFLLFFLFGLTWVFGLFMDNIVMIYLFCLTATLQGFILFLFFILGNKKTRDMWLVCLRFKEKKKFPVTTSTTRSVTRASGIKNDKIIAMRNADFKNSSKPRAMTGITDNTDSRFS